MSDAENKVPSNDENNEEISNKLDSYSRETRCRFDKLFLNGKFVA
jgi:hypothetical protein